jgi:nucleoside-diphosphate-sugar epimerase
MQDISNIKLKPTSTIKEALKIIDSGAIKIALVVDSDDKLLGTITDGDIRRAILDGKDLEDSIEGIYFKSPTTIIRNALSGNPIPIYGDGKNIRDWLYVLDHCKGIDLAYHKGKAGKIYNIGGKNERTNLQIVNTICEILDKVYPLNTNTQITNNKLTSYKDLITFVEDRVGHDKRYTIDATKIEKTLGWKAEETFETGIEKTVEWYLEKYDAE